jgi:succinate dehydrogenase / fumarate reductase cytochrome b subunit
MEKKTRPISPHLTIYKPQITSVMSIIHRMTGIVLFFGLILFTWFLIIAVYTELVTNNYDFLGEVANNCFFKIVMFGWTLSLFLHLYNGLRYLMWDSGNGFDMKTVTKTGYLALCLASISAVVVWYIVLR